jgi:hypothetical protein
LESLLGFLLIWILLFLIHELYYHLTNGTTENKKLNTRLWTFVEYNYLKSEPPYCAFTPRGKSRGIKDQSQLDGRNEENPSGQGTKANG